MRLVSIASAVVMVLLSGPASAQAWDAYVNRENFFTVNFPGEPRIAETPYRTERGTVLPGRVFTAVAPPGTLLSGTYRVTVVDYSNAVDEISGAVEHAANAIRAKGVVKYDGLNNLDLHVSRRLTVETPSSRILAEILFAANNRLYMTEAEQPLDVPPAANFQASLQILDENGVRIRERTVLGLPAGVTSPIGAGGVPDESDRIAGLLAGMWRSPGGTCDAAYFTAGERARTTRGEQALTGTVTNAGMTISGLLIVNGARQGQFIDPATDRAIFLFDPEPGRISFSAIGAPALGWPDVTLEPCPERRG